MTVQNKKWKKFRIRNKAIEAYQVFFSQIIETENGICVTAPEDWIIKTGNGNSYRIKPDLFDQLFKPA